MNRWGNAFFKKLVNRFYWEHWFITLNKFFTYIVFLLLYFRQCAHYQKSIFCPSPCSWSLPILIPPILPCPSPSGNHSLFSVSMCLCLVCSFILFSFAWKNVFFKLTWEILELVIIVFHYVLLIKGVKMILICDLFYVFFSLSVFQPGRRTDDFPAFWWTSWH